MGLRLYRGTERHLALAVAVLVLPLMGVVLHRDMQQTRTTTRQVVHAEELLRAIGSVRENLARMESAARGYLLAPSELFLEQRERAIARLNGALAQLERLTTADPQQQARTQELLELSARRVRQNSQLMSPMAGTYELLAANDLTIQVYALTTAMEDAELRRLGLRQAEYQREQQRGVLMLAAVIAGGIFLMVPAYLDAARQRRLRAHAERRMADLVENLPLTAWQMQTLPGGIRRYVYIAPSTKQQPRALIDDMRSDVAPDLGKLVEEDRARVRAAMERSERSLEPFDETYRVQTLRGERWVRTRATLRMMRDGSVLWSGYWQDVTRQKRIEQELRHANGELEAFAYSVSHDLRAPLSAVQGFAQALREHAGAALDGRAHHYLARIQAAAQQMSELIDGLLQLAQVTRQHIESDTVDLSTIAAEVVAGLREAEPQRMVDVQIEPGLTACGDTRLLRQVVVNLLSNAWKFTRGCERARIEVGRGTTPQGENYFFVKDNGAGFDMAYAEQLFGAFQRLHSGREFPGTGIGLATVMRIISRHGGRVWGEGAVGNGAVFRFTLPAAGENSEPRTATA